MLVSSTSPSPSLSPGATPFRGVESSNMVRTLGTVEITWLTKDVGSAASAASASSKVLQHQNELKSESAQGEIHTERQGLGFVDGVRTERRVGGATGFLDLSNFFFQRP